MAAANKGAVVIPALILGATGIGNIPPSMTSKARSAVAVATSTFPSSWVMRYVDHAAPPAATMPIMIHKIGEVLMCVSFTACIPLVNKLRGSRAASYHRLVRRGRFAFYQTIPALAGIVYGTRKPKGGEGNP